MPDTQFKILCPNGTTHFSLCVLITKLNIDKIKIRPINLLDVTYEICNLTAKQSRAIIQAFADEGYAVTALPQPFFYAR